MSQPITLTLAQRAPRPLRWLGILLVLGLLCMPFLALLPASHPLAVPSWLLTLSGKILCYAIVAVALDLVWGYAGMLSLGHGIFFALILCYAIVAVALDLVWGYAGMLSLGHGIFFALGGYAMGMYLMRQAAGDGLPAFMSFLSWSELPWFWWGTQHFAWAMALVVLVPGLLALVFGWFAFRSKIKGVYFSIMTQALTYAGMLLFFRNETGFGGNNGFTGFTTLLGFPVTATGTRASLFMATVLLLLLTLWLGAALAQSKFGRILTAVRDAENRLMFCGYDPRGFKLLVWTLSAVLCGLAGALYVPQVGIINPSEMSPTNSIEAAIWVALGGRGTLIGPVLGAGLVNGAKSIFTVAMPEYWQLFLGLIFIIVTLFLPRGVMGLLRRGDR
ncbi:urea ABC transporter permease subunit UrtC [Klebsiella pneumoniae]|nr:urea ABC transporter permease subunit UrtC [Klebsiella pneumoniae]